MNKIVLITGASGDIGAEIAKIFADNGYDLYLMCHRNYDYLRKLKGVLEEEYGIRCSVFTADIGKYEQVSEVFKHIGDIDVLINNAGIAHYGLTGDMSPKQWRQVMDININGMFYTVKEVLPGMIHKKSGKIINVSSIWGIAGASMEVAYSTSKGAVNAFTKALAKELAPSNIQVNAIAFGVIDTKMNAHLSQEEKEELCQGIPMGRFAAPKEAARMIWQTVCLPEYVTGQIIAMDGGFL